MLNSQALGETQTKTKASWVLRLKRGLRGLPHIPVIILALFLFCGIFGKAIAPHDPTKTNIRAARTPPFFQEGGSTTYFLGTDAIGRDIFSRIIIGAGISLQVGFTVVVIAGALGALVALF